MIIVGTLTGLSVGKLFVAGILPGIMLGVGMMLIVYIIAKKGNYPIQKRSTLKESIKSFVNGIWSIIMVFIILFGILGGFFTPTEASIVAVLYALLVGIFIYKQLNLSNIFVIIKDSIKTTAGIMLLVGFANIFAWILATENIPQLIATSLLSVTSNKIIILLLVNIVFLFAGMFLETISALLILVTVLLKVVTAVGVDPIQFGLIAVLNLVIGLTTPPVGVCLFVASDIGKVPLTQSIRGLIPFFIWMMIVLLSVTYIPAITLWLPSLLGN